MPIEAKRDLVTQLPLFMNKQEWKRIMLNAIIVLFVIPVFLIVFVTHILYDLYKIHEKHKAFEKKLKKKYPLAYENK